MSTFDYSGYKHSESEYVTTLIKPEGSAVHKIEVQYRSNKDSRLTGLRLQDK